jgi:hypothetical protein
MHNDLAEGLQIPLTPGATGLLPAPKSDAATPAGPDLERQDRSESRESMRHRPVIYHLSLAESRKFWPLKPAYQALRSPRLV